MNQIEATLKSTQDKSSSELELIHCINKKAVEDDKCLKITSIIKCRFCNVELTKSSCFLKSSTGYKSDGLFEWCTCKESKKYREQFPKEAEEEKEKQEAERGYNERLECMMKDSNLGERFKSRTFSTYKITIENKIAYETCRRYTEKFKDLRTKGIGLLITGNYGAGKTHLVAAIANELINEGYQPIFGTLISLLGKLKASYEDSYSKENEERIIGRYTNCALLIIDDLGKEKPSEWILEKLYYIINCRYENYKPIVITSNYDETKLINRLTVGGNVETAEAIVSRLNEICQGLNMKGCKDYRKSSI